MATIITKNSQTASAVPSAASLSVGELAVNTADGKLYTEHTGGVVKEIIPSTVVDGGITAAKIATGAVTADKIATSAVTTTKIADANVTGAKLENSGVAAGTYGSASVVPVVTVDAKGRLTTVSTATIAASAPTTAQVLSATASASYDAVGTYVFARLNSNSYSGNGITVPGSVLSGAGTYVEIATSDWAGTLSGTWRCMGRTYIGGALSVYLRIS